jgi:hypothetical protein
MSFAALLPDFDGPGTPLQIVDTGLLWGPAVPLSKVPDDETGQALLATLVAVDSTGDRELDGAVAEVLACDLSGVVQRPSRAGSIRHALTEQALGSAAAKDPDWLRVFARANLWMGRLTGALTDRTLAERIVALGGNWRDEPVPAPWRDQLVVLANG